MTIVNSSPFAPVMNMFPIAQLVESPDRDAQIFFNFNDNGSYPEHESFVFGAPSLKGEPGSVNPEYDYRTISFNLVVPGDEDDVLRQHSALARQITRDTFYFRFQLSWRSEPIWFKCVRAAPGETSLADFFMDRIENTWKIAVTLIAEPFAMGERLEHSLTFANNPTAVGLAAELPPIRGDVPTPLIIEVAAGDSNFIRPYLSVCPLESSRAWVNPLPFWQAEAAKTISTGGASEVTTAASNNSRIRYNFTTTTTNNTFQRRLTWDIAPPFPGRWRIFCRMGSNIVTESIRIEGSGEACVKSHKTILNSAEAVFSTMVDLGVFSFPKGNMPVSPGPNGPGGIRYTLANSGVGLNMGVPEGTAGNVWFDYIVAVPLDLPVDCKGEVTTLNFRDEDRTRGLVALRIDGEEGIVQEIGVNGVLGVGNPELPAGNVLMATPGAKNIFTFLPRRAYTAIITVINPTGPDTTTDVFKPRDIIAETNTFKISYRPRWLYFSDI